VCVNLWGGALSFWDFTSPLASCSYGVGNGRLRELHPISGVFS